MGQITIQSEFGNLLKEICKHDSTIRTVVEIGTWDGMGSTECVIRGLQESDKTDIFFVSLECNPEMHKTACDSWKENLPDWAVLLHGRIVDIDEMDSSDLTDQEKNWFQQDVDNITSSPNVLHLVPDKIDMLILDGGEFTTKSEFLKLVDRSRMIVLDDTKIRKCKWIREQVLSDTDRYKLIFDAPEYRNGVMIFSVNSHRRDA
jgi:hypothetical protein